MSRATNQPELASQATRDDSPGEASSVPHTCLNTPPLVQEASNATLGCDSPRSEVAAHDGRPCARRKSRVESSFKVLTRPYRDLHNSRRTRTALQRKLLKRLPYIVAVHAPSDYGTLAAAATGLDLVTVRADLHVGVIREGWVVTSSQSLNEEHVVAKLAVARAYCEATGLTFRAFTGDEQ